MTRTLRIAAAAILFTVSTLGFAAPASGDGPEDSRPANLQVTTALPAGTRSYAAGAWGLVEISVGNRSDRPAKVLGSAYFEDVNQQYGREFLIPARSRRYTWLPVLVPPGAAAGQAHLDIKTLTIDRTGPSERVVPDSGGRTLSDGILPLDRDGSITCWIGGAEPELPGRSNDDITDMVLAARYRRGLSRKFVSIHGLALPPGAETLQGIEHLVISSDRPLNDPAGLDALREWTARGGRLWVLLDRVSPALAEQLLGDACRIEPVDRIGLTTMRLVGVGPAAGSSDPEPREFEKPAEMVRVIAEGVEVLHMAEGWPASFAQKVGRGEVLFTTLDPRAWVRPRRRSDIRTASWAFEPDRVVGEPLDYLSERLMGSRQETRIKSDLWEPLLTEQIGVRIASRGTVAAALGGYCALLVVSAVVFGRRQRLDRMAWVAPALSLAAAAGLGAFGIATARAVPQTVAEGQLIETTPGSADVSVSGELMFYDPSTEAVELGAAGGGIFLPDMSGFSDRTRRMVWTDWDRWHTENFVLPAGARVAPFLKDMTLSEPVSARGTFGEAGFSGRISGPLADVSDAVIATPTGGTLAVRASNGGEIEAGPQDVLPTGSYLPAALLSDSQRRRQDLYRRLLGPAGRPDALGGRAMLLAWVRPLPLGFTYPSESAVRGEALAALPLVIDRSPPGSRVTIPSSFVSTESIAAPGGLATSPLFNKRTGEAAERFGDAEAWVRFELPEQVLPLDVETADVSVAVSGAVGSLELLGLVGERVESLRVWNAPAGTSSLRIDRRDVLDLDARGGLRLGLRIKTAQDSSDATSSRSTSLKQYWRVESVRLEAAGRTRQAAAGERRETTDGR